MLEKRPTVRH